MYSAILEGKAASWFCAARTRSWFAAVLILVLCALALSACGSGGNGGGEADGNATGEGSSAPVEFEYGNEVEHWNVALPDRSRDSFDEVAYNAALQEFRTAMDGDDASALLNAYDKLERLSPIRRAIVRLPTSIARAPALTRPLRARMRQSRRRMTAITKSAHRHSWMRLNRSTERLSGPILGEGFSSVLDNSSTMSSESAALRAKCDNLANQYSALVSRDASDAEFKRLYVELVNANNAWARSLGYENYVEYVFATEYGRDYAMAEIEAAQDEVAREFVPVYQSYVADVMGDDIDGAFDALDESEETLMTNARACVARVSPALGGSFDHLVDNGLYDISASEAKVRNSYAAEMAAYNDGCVLRESQYRSGGLRGNRA